MKTTASLTLFLALALLALVFLALDAPTAYANPGVRRVKTSGTTLWPCGDQSNWSNACALQTALTNAPSGDELWVAAGTYKPTTGTSRAATFQLRNGIALYGGFAGTETARALRNVYGNKTILSGDIGTPGNASDNAYHVVTAGSVVTESAVLDGFTITAGNANGASYPDDRGGGMFSDGGNPTLMYLSFEENSAGYDGGGMHSAGGNPTLSFVTFLDNAAATSGGGMYNAGGNPTLTSVMFIGNNALSGAGMFNSGGSPKLVDAWFEINDGTWGGGMHNTGGSSPTVRDSYFFGNSASFGGGVYNNGGSSKLTNVTFQSNHATDNGGGLFNINCSPMLTNTTFVSNWARDGGGMSSHHSTPTLNNVTLSSNSATGTGGGIQNALTSTATIRNTILWGNTAPTNPQIHNDPSNPNTANVYDSVVQGGYAGGTHIVTADPRLGLLGYYGGTYSGGSVEVIPLLQGSSAIDAGNNPTCATTDQRGVARPIGSQCDIGAFEGVIYQAHLPLMRK